MGERHGRSCTSVRRAGKATWISGRGQRMAGNSRCWRNTTQRPSSWCGRYGPEGTLKRDMPPVARAMGNSVSQDCDGAYSTLVLVFQMNRIRGRIELVSGAVRHIMCALFALTKPQPTARSPQPTAHSRGSRGRPLMLQPTPVLAARVLFHTFPSLAASFLIWEDRGLAVTISYTGWG